MAAIEYFCAEGMLLDIDVADKEAAVGALVEAAAAMGKIKRGKTGEVIEKVMEREAVGSTGIGHGVAVPHARSGSVKELVGVFGRLKEAVPFDALDGQPVDLVFLLLSPPTSSGEHLPVLAKVAVIARDETYCRFLRQAGAPSETLEILKEAFASSGA